MQQTAVQIIQAQQLEALIQSTYRLGKVRRPDFGKHKQRFARLAALPQGFAHRVFIVVIRGRINITVAAGHSLPHGQGQFRS